MIINIVMLLVLVAFATLLAWLAALFLGTGLVPTSAQASVLHGRVLL